MCKERMMSFTTPMVQAIIDLTKSQTRRPVKEQQQGFVEVDEYKWYPDGTYRAIVFDGHDFGSLRSPFGGPGDVILVRESARVVYYGGMYKMIDIRYDADNSLATVMWPNRMTWKPIPGHKIPNGCHKEAVRIKRVVMRVWVERVQDITNEQAISEGIEPFDTTDDGRVITWKAKDGMATFLEKVSFKDLWDSIYNSWDQNPWVWCCEFEKPTPAASDGVN